MNLRQLSPLGLQPRPRPRPPLLETSLAERELEGWGPGTAALIGLGMTCLVQLQGQPQPAQSDGDLALRKSLYTLPLECARPEQIDGYYLGGDGLAYSPRHFLAHEVPGFQPAHPTGGRSYYVNGILTWPHGPEQADGEAQKLADATGREVVVIYNATSGSPALDGLQTLADRSLRSGDPAVATLRATLQSESHPWLIGYSQGAAVISAALESEPGRPVEVLTLGGAGILFPRQVHLTALVNQQDPVANWLGLHPGWLIHDPAVRSFNDPGRPGAQITDTDGPHGLDTYLAAYRQIHP